VTYKTLAIVFLAVGFLFHFIGLLPFIGIFFGLIGIVLDLVGFIMLCLIPTPPKYQPGPYQVGYPPPRPIDRRY
jgi:hypothetical protein